MPISPSQKKKLENPPLPEFKPGKKKIWDPPNKNTFTVDSLAEELGTVSNNLLSIVKTLAEPCSAEQLSKAKNELQGSARHLESVYNRLLSHGIIARQSGVIAVFHADDLPF